MVPMARRFHVHAPQVVITLSALQAFNTQSSTVAPCQLPVRWSHCTTGRQLVVLDTVNKWCQVCCVRRVRLGVPSEAPATHRPLCSRCVCPRPK